MVEVIDILQQPNNRRVRKEINNICDSYSHPWDVVAELCQNAVDAIDLHTRRHPDSGVKHRVEVTVDARDRSIIVRDTGVGIDPNELPELLEPHSTNKDDDDLSIGEKGVGLTYTMFACNDYDIRTQSTQGFTQGRLGGGSTWRHSTGDVTPPKFERAAIDVAPRRPDETYTEVRVVGVESSSDDSFDLFSLTDKQLEYTLRSKTALGFTDPLFGLDTKSVPHVSVTHIDSNGKKTHSDIPFCHVSPEDYVKAGDVVDMDDFKAWTAAQQPTDAQKRRKLKGKMLRRRGSVDVLGRKIDYYVAYVSSRNFWGETCEASGLQLPPALPEEPPVNMLAGGIYVSTKGMPTGILLQPPNVGLATYFSNMFIVIEDDKIEFDIGRKHIHGRIQQTLRGVVRDAFLEFRPFFKLMSIPPEGGGREERRMERVKVFAELGKLPKLQVPGMNVVRHPDDQEAAVVAIFHELVAAGHLPGYYTYRIGYKERYDFWGEFKIDAHAVDQKWRHLANDGVVSQQLVAEFKYGAESVVADLLGDLKHFSDLDLLVCWDLDEKKLAAQGIEVEHLAPEDSVFSGVNYRLVFPGMYGSDAELPVIGLRRLCEALSL